MKILIIEQHDKERSVIREAIQAGRHDAVWAQNADEAWELVNAGEIRIVIADAETSDVTASKLIRRGQAMNNPPVYFLMLTSHEKKRSRGEDILHKPVTANGIQNRLIIGQRLLTLLDDLSHAPGP